MVGTAYLPVPYLRSTGLANNSESCLAELGLHNVSVASSIAMVTAAELGGFVLLVVIIIYCMWKTRKSLQEVQALLTNTKERRKL